MGGCLLKPSLFHQRDEGSSLFWKHTKWLLHIFIWSWLVAIIKKWKAEQREEFCDQDPAGKHPHGCHPDIVSFLNTLAEPMIFLEKHLDPVMADLNNFHDLSGHSILPKALDCGYQSYLLKTEDQHLNKTFLWFW